MSDKKGRIYLQLEINLWKLHSIFIKFQQFLSYYRKYGTNTGDKYWPSGSNEERNGNVLFSASNRDGAISQYALFCTGIFL